jgi:predicted membrane metal-binding protein
MSSSLHEDLSRSAIKHGSTDRNFGLVFAAVFAFLGFWPLHAKGQVRIPLLVVAGVFLIVAVVRPSLLRPLNKVWTLLGLLMGRIVNPIMTAILFFGVFMPVSLILRMLRKDLLRLKSLPEADTYWIVRHPPGPSPETMGKQF